MATSDIMQSSVKHVHQEPSTGSAKVKSNVDDVHSLLQELIQASLEEDKGNRELVIKKKPGTDEFSHGARIPNPGTYRDWGKFKGIIGPTLATHMSFNKELQHSVITALRKIEFATDKDDIVEAVSETDPENPNWTQNLIKVQLNTQDLEEWKHKKKQIESIAIEARAGDIKLHTFVERKDNKTDVG